VRITNTKFHQYNKDINKKLRHLKSLDPKSYWSLLNRYSGEKSKVVSKISAEVFLEHFSKLNKSSEGNDNEFDLSLIADYNEELNKQITDSEILCAISNLHNNKSCSMFDNILNEYIKYSKHIMLPVLCRLFNLILDSGIIPEEWCKGIIFPIYKKG
jgi:hypothetical protein